MSEKKQEPTIDQKLNMIWDKLNILEQRIGVIHEICYNELFIPGQKGLDKEMEKIEKEEGEGLSKIREESDKKKSVRNIIKEYD